jgi:hypothetical protein
METDLVESFVIQAKIPTQVRGTFETVVLKNATLRKHLHLNRFLTRETWFALYKPKTAKGKAGVALTAAQSLAGRRLDKQQRLHVLANEERARVLNAMIKVNALDPDEQDLLVANPGFCDMVATNLLKAKWVTWKIARVAAEHLGGQQLLDFLVDVPDTELTPAETAEIMSRFAQWGPATKPGENKGAWRRKIELERLLDTKPYLLPVAVAAGQHDSVLSAACGSRKLTDPVLQRRAAGLDQGIDRDRLFERRFALMVLVNNPVVPAALATEVADLAEKFDPRAFSNLIESARTRAERRPVHVQVPFEQVNDEEILDWLVKRTRSYYTETQHGTRTKLGKIRDIEALAANPNLTERHAIDIRSHLEDEDIYPHLGGETVDRARRAFSATHPGLTRPAWTEGPSGRDYDPDEMQYDDAGEEYAAYHDRYDEEQSLKLTLDSVRRYGGTGALVHAATRLGTHAERWEVFLKLAADYDGTVGELIEVSEYV